MLGIFKTAYFGAKCVDTLEVDDVLLAREYYGKIPFKRLTNPRLIALGARISLLENDTKAALPQLRKALNAAQYKNTSKAEYVQNYCMYFIELIRRSGEHETFRQAALALNPGEFCTDSLPLPDREITLQEVEDFNKIVSPAIH